MQKKRDGLEKVFAELSKTNAHYKRNLSFHKNSRSFLVTPEMITTEDFLFGGFSCFEAAALLFHDQTPQNRFDFEISYLSPISVGQTLVLNRKDETKVLGSNENKKAIQSTTSTPITDSVSKPKELNASVQGIKELQPSVVSYNACEREDLRMLFHLCCFFDRCTWLLGQKEYQHANFLTAHLAFDVQSLPSDGPLYLHAREIKQKRLGGSSLMIQADAIDSNSNLFAKTKCTLIRVCPETKQVLAL